MAKKTAKYGIQVRENGSHLGRLYPTMAEAQARICEETAFDAQAHKAWGYSIRHYDIIEVTGNVW